MTVYTLGLNTGDTGGCEDASLIKASINTNFGSSVYFQVGVPTVTTEINRGVIKFTGMPTGSGGSVTGASLRLTCADSASAVGVSVRGLLTAFVEAGATWNDRNATPTAWNVAGALTGTDVSGTVSGTGTIPASGGGNFTISGAGMNALVLSMIEGTNNGMLVYCTDETTANYNNLMRSSQRSDGERPQLTFDYTAGAATTSFPPIRSQGTPFAPLTFF